MDLPLYAQVLRRHWIVVTLGIVLAVVLAALSYGHPAYEDGKLTWKYRAEERWQSEARVLLSVPGFPVGSAALSPGRRADEIAQAQAQLPTLAVLYAGLTTGDDVRSIVRQASEIRGRVVAAAATATNGMVTLPIVEITAVAPSGPGSRVLADRYASALIGYVEGQQADRAPEQRVDLSLLNRGGETELVDPRSKTLPIIVFLALLTATVGVAFALENVKTRRSSSDDVARKVQSDQRVILPSQSPHTLTAAPMTPGVGGGRAHEQPAGSESKPRLAQ
jgi:hypothetical protein